MSDSKSSSDSDESGESDDEQSYRPSDLPTVFLGTVVDRECDGRDQGVSNKAKAAATAHTTQEQADKQKDEIGSGQTVKRGSSARHCL